MSNSPPPPVGVGHLWVFGFAKNLGGWVPEITPCHPLVKRLTCPNLSGSGVVDGDDVENGNDTDGADIYDADALKETDDATDDANDALTDDKGSGNKRKQRAETDVDHKFDPDEHFEDVCITGADGDNAASSSAVAHACASVSSVKKQTKHLGST